MPWYKDFFDENYNKTYLHLNWERTAREADFIEKVLELEKDDLILDIPCGFGRHSIELTKRGYHVIGMEYNYPQIDMAMRIMVEKKATFDIIQADMRDISHENRYDKMFNYFTSFGYFNSEENEKTMAGFHRALKPGGLLLIEMVNRDGVLKSFQPCNINRLPDGGLLLEERKFDPLTSRMNAVHTFISTEGQIVERQLDHRMYCPHELVGMFERHGFEVVKTFGDGENNLKKFSRRIAIVGKKK
ncbi:MAG: class I SAM-dependent methyltransferase [Candidatus Eremiobacteraeota bacterium]|nr:class I SAM-dependent methyltransferase [Candidatus Eremiobacteraeota bacterium]